ncbi:hypothetical protein [Saccharothrix sp. ST-888]|uniref:hypothetical protein n=1 Tax=Saccharothrix sp. ST-888 TaxID=1427391 RepID=UPI000ADEA0E2|nr:hypothetical protein [Saccharothrix sp. ST-888]
MSTTAASDRLAELSNVVGRLSEEVALRADDKPSPQDLAQRWPTEPNPGDIEAVN